MREVQRKVGSRRMDLRCSCRGETTAEAGRKGEIPGGRIQCGWGEWCSVEEAGWLDCGGGVRRGGGEDEEEAVDEAGWEDSSVAPAMIFLAPPLLTPARPLPAPWNLRPLLPLSTTATCSGSEGGEGGLEA